MANKKKKAKNKKMNKVKTASMRQRVKRKELLYNVTYYNPMDIMKVNTAERNGRRRRNTTHRRLLKSNWQPRINMNWVGQLIDTKFGKIKKKMNTRSRKVRTQ
jgi:hypothetical protein